MIRPIILVEVEGHHLPLYKDQTSKALCEEDVSSSCIKNLEIFLSPF